MIKTSIRGMVQVAGVTYRIVRVRAREYEVVRVLDDTRIGTFSLATAPAFSAEENALDIVKSVARAALQGARTSWVPRRENRPD